MKKVFLVLILTGCFFITKAQDEENGGEEKKGGFKKENLFVGGDITLGFSSGYTALGASPYFGYSLNKYIDVAASFNVNYISQRINDGFTDYGDKLRQTVYGPGAFVRVYPFKFVFAQAQFEHNFVKVKYLATDISPYLSYTESVDANSFLLGAGYAGGRGDDSKSFYYFSISWDLLRNSNSPYVDELGRGVPIIRAGYNIALFQGNGRRRR
ncbi:MAG: hypothetical protein IPL84_18210 [Chitinophagaceae bacterium]|nr:hypothetical protein [Chitinophagaceae bacterium]